MSSWPEYESSLHSVHPARYTTYPSVTYQSPLNQIKRLSITELRVRITLNAYSLQFIPSHGHYTFLHHHKEMKASKYNTIILRENNHILLLQYIITILLLVIIINLSLYLASKLSFTKGRSGQKKTIECTGFGTIYGFRNLLRVLKCFCG